MTQSEDICYAETVALLLSIFCFLNDDVQEPPGFLSKMSGM